ncbi:hypothetical protein ACS0TY_025278 [Phlomoides rotata]
MGKGVFLSFHPRIAVPQIEFPQRIAHPFAVHVRQPASAHTTFTSTPAYTGTLDCRTVSMDDDREIEVLLITLFGLIAQLFNEINTFVVLMSYGFLNFRRQSKHRKISYASQI